MEDNLLPEARVGGENPVKSLQVDPRLRHQGGQPRDEVQRVGSALINKVEARCEKQGCGQIIWAVLAGNEAAMQFYARHYGRAESKWQNWAFQPPSVSR